jgi:subtilisin family serine protease
MIRLATLMFATACMVFLGGGCGSSSTSPGDTPGDGYTEPQPNGVLLDGEDTENAIAAIKTLPPAAADEAEIDGTFITTRLTAILDPQATVGDVNSLLESHDARITCMRKGLWFATLKIPPVADVAEAETLAARLTVDGTFLFVFPAYAPMPVPVDGGDTCYQDEILPPSGVERLAHLIAIKVPAAWNAKGLAESVNNKVTVVVPDVYYSDEGHDELDFAQFRYRLGDFSKSQNNGAYRGNHGYAVCGIIGAKFNDWGVTGMSPDPANLLRLIAIPVGNYSAWDRVARMVDEIGGLSGKFVVNTSLGYNDPEFKVNGIVERAAQAVMWRLLASETAGRMLHAASAGNDGRVAGKGGETRYNSAYLMAHHFGDVWSMVEGENLTDEDHDKLQAAWEMALRAYPAAAAPTDNVLSVGSSKADGSESSFSSRGADVRAVGENVWSTCVKDDGSCSNGFSMGDGTSFASPQMAGLAAYMWNLKPGLSPQEIVTKIEHAYASSATPGLVDAYMAVLSIDAGQSMQVRAAILDVAGNTPSEGSNGKFDENDIELFLDQFEEYEGVRSTGLVLADYSRYDLNGDGFTGGSTTAKFDLTADATPAFTTASTYIEYHSEEFDENQVTDCDVLRYYAYSPLFSGDSGRRRELMTRCGGIDLSGHVRLLVQLGVYGSFVKTDQTTFDLAYAVDTGSDGAVTGTSIAYQIDETYVNGSTTVHHAGQITGELENNGTRVKTLNVSYTSTTTTNGQLARTDVISFTLEDIPWTYQSEHSVWYEVRGTNTCEHITALSSQTTTTSGGWQLTGRSCTEDSDIWLQFILP